MAILRLNIIKIIIFYLCEFVVELIRHPKAVQQVQCLHGTELVWEPGGCGQW